MPIIQQRSQQILRFTQEEAEALARDLFGVKASARPLPSERGQSFLLDRGAGPEFVLKIVNGAEDRQVIEAQNAVLEHLALRDPTLRCPRLKRTTAGEVVGNVRGPDGSRHDVWLLTFFSGHLLAEVSPHSLELLESFGVFFGRLDRALAGVSHPALNRDLQWDLRLAGSVVARHLGQISDPARRQLVKRYLHRFQTFVEPKLPGLRTSIIHNGGNGHNILVGPDPAQGPFGLTVNGAVDFGDLVKTHTLCEVAICAAYAVLGKADPVGAAARVVGGYHHAFSLTEAELDLLLDLIVMRLCTSVALAAEQKASQPDNASLTVSERPAWTALERVATVCPRLFTYAFRQACGLPACPGTATVVRWLETHAEDIGPVVEPDLREGASIVFDLTPGNSDFTEMEDPNDPVQWTDLMVRRMRVAGAQVGIGRYGEARRCYTTEAYRRPSSEVEEWRTVHLGMDLFLPPGSPVFAPLAGRIHSYRDNAQALDYGPTIILRHETEGACEFFTLYGHLSPESLLALSEGMPIAKGAKLGTIGDSTVNGQWPPHVHVQLIVDLLDHPGNFPGVCAGRDRALWQSLCPDPNLILRIPFRRILFGHVPDEPRHRIGRSPEAILADRKRYLGPNLTVSYARPLSIVRGWKQFLYDHFGREYLDAMNNVAHVGYSHPRVVRAAAEQMAVLNTNTRYLHDRLVEYAERLTATLPDPLKVCYFTCSGSEANELALRLVRAHTGATHIVVVEGGYHGNTTTLADISPYTFDGPGGGGAPPFVHKVPMPGPLRGPYRGNPCAGRLYARHVRDAVEQASRQGQRVAAFICESLLSCGGQIVLPPDYLVEAYRVIREHRGLCIADEVQVGFGRVGSHFWGFQLQSVVPDIVTMGKSIGNGHPLGAVVTTQEIAASFARGGMEYFNTFGGNPVSCAVGLAVLDVVEEEGLQAHSLAVGRHLKEALKGLMAGGHSLIGDVRGEGLFLGVELVRHSETPEPAGKEAAYVAERMKDLGILIGADGSSRNVLKIKPPMVFTKADADRLTTALDQVLSEPRLAHLCGP